MKRLLTTYLGIFLLTTAFAAPTYTLVAHAETTGPQELEYELLEPLPSAHGPVTTTKDLSDYVIFMFQLLIGIAIGLAVIMIIVGGMEYITSELPGGKSDGKKRIMGALWGLALALGSYIILNTIDPDILNSDLRTETSPRQTTTGASNVSTPSQ